MVFSKLLMETEIVVRHLQVLKAVIEKQPIGIFKLSDLLNMPKHRVRYSLRILEQSGIVVPTQYGAMIKDEGYTKIENLKLEFEKIKEMMAKIEETIKSF